MRNLVCSLALCVACSTPAAAPLTTADAQHDVSQDAAADTAEDSAAPADAVADAVADPCAATACDLGASRDPQNSCACVDLSAAASPQGPDFEQRLCLSSFIWGNDATAAAKRAFLWQASKELGVHEIRWDFRWELAEPQQGNFNWQAIDTAVTEMNAHGIKMLALLGYGVPWASKLGAQKGDSMYPPDNPQDFANFAGAVAKHVGSAVQHYELWNEQNAGYRFWKGTPDAMSGDPVAYAKLAHLAADAVHAANPQAVVTFGGLFYIGQMIPSAEKFLAASLAADPTLASALDGVAWHPYALYPPMNPPEFANAPGSAVPQVPVDQTAVQMQKLYTQGGAKPKALWITELGWPSAPADKPGAAISEWQVARFLARSWVLAARQGTQLLCWYTLLDHDPAADGVLWEKYFGLYHFDPNPLDDVPPVPKPAALVHARLAKLLTSMGFMADERSRSTAPYQFAFGRADGTRQVHIAWDPQATPGVAPDTDATHPAYFYRRPGRAYRLASFAGDWVSDAALPLLSADASGRITFAVGPTPVAIIETAL